MGLPPAAGQVDQHLGPQVRPLAARRRLGGLAREGGPARGSDLQRQLPGRRDGDLRATTSCAWARRATARSRRPATRRRSTWPTRSARWAPSRCSSAAT
jgi:hypothetical protein